MNTFKPIRGINSQDIAENFLSVHFNEINSKDVKICPMINDICGGARCAAWVKAEVYCTNPSRPDNLSMYNIRPGYCRSPVITGKVDLI
jgi:hypothetical protein